jgi:putative ABC transport system substrate-binding protein
MLGMRRRELITLLGGAAAAWPFSAPAQQPGKAWRMGFIARGHETFYDALFEGLRELGYVEGRNLVVERRYAGDRTERFQEFAAETVRRNVNIIIVVTTPAALAVKKKRPRPFRLCSPTPSIREADLVLPRWTCSWCRLFHSGFCLAC